MGEFRTAKWKTWEDVKKFESDIDDYFAKCEKKGEMPLLSGLAVHLGVHRDTLWDYENGNNLNMDENLSKEEEEKNNIKRACGDLIKKAKQRIDYAVDRLGFVAKNPAYAIFYKKSALGYRETDALDVNMDQTATIKLVFTTSPKPEDSQK